jgi:hypothetical protein
MAAIDVKRRGPLLCVLHNVPPTLLFDRIVYKLLFQHSFMQEPYQADILCGIALIFGVERSLHPLGMIKFYVTV